MFAYSCCTAVWTRFFPIAYKWQDLLFNDKVIGDVTTLFADLALPVFGNLPDTHRMFAPELAGGAQLDLGPYPLVWALMSLFQHPKNARSPPSRVAGSMMPHPSTGAAVPPRFLVGPWLIVHRRRRHRQHAHARL